MRSEVLRLKKKPEAYSEVVENTQRRAGITNKPKVVQHYETHREPKRKKKRMFRTGDEIEERDPLSWIDLKDSPRIKTRPVDTWQKRRRIRDAAHVRILQAARDRQNTLITKIL